MLIMFIYFISVTDLLTWLIENIINIINYLLNISNFEKSHELRQNMVL
jgi:hypothetical protein